MYFVTITAPSYKTEQKKIPSSQANPDMKTSNSGLI